MLHENTLFRIRLFNYDVMHLLLLEINNVFNQPKDIAGYGRCSELESESFATLKGSIIGMHNNIRVLRSVPREIMTQVNLYVH